MNKKVKHLTIAGIPAYNEERTIARVVIEASKFVDKIIVVDDGSSDMTGEIAKRVGAKVIRHPVRLGKGEGFRTIFKLSRKLDADVLVTLDADGQSSPREIPIVLEPVVKGKTDICVGSRFLGKKPSEMPRYRWWGTRLIRRFTTSTSNLSIKDTESGFRAYGRKALSCLIPSEMGMGVDSELLLKANEKGLKIVEVPISVAYKDLDTSKHGPLFHGLDVIFSVLKHLSIRHPLMFFGFPGLISIVVGLGFGYWTFETYTNYHYLSTTLSLVAVGVFSMGVLLLSIGVMLFTLISVLRDRI